MKTCLILLALFAVGLVRGVPFFDHLDALNLGEKSVCTVDKWQGRAVSSYPLLHVMSFSNISYSWAQHKVYIEAVILKKEEQTHHKDKFEALFDFDNKIIYIIDSNNTCACHELHHKMHQACVPKKAECYGTATIGGSLEVDTYHWYDKKSEDQKGISYTAILSHKKNVPVSVYYHTETSSGSSQFFDVVEHIEDPSVFKRPSQCSCGDEKRAVPSVPESVSDIGLEHLATLPLDWISK